MRINRWPVTKSAIKKEQTAISDSVNVSKTINDNLKKDNTHLIKEIERIEKTFSSIQSQEKEYNEKRDLAKSNYIQAKVLLSDKEKDIQELKSKETSFLLENRLIQEDIRKKTKDLEWEYKKEEAKLEAKLDSINSEVRKAETKRFSIAERASDEKAKYEVFESKINKWKTELNQIEKDKTSIEKESKKLKDQISDDKLSIELYEQAILDIKQKKIDTQDELGLVQADLFKDTKDLVKVKKELESARYTTITLIKKEERLNQREKILKDMYDKAWLEFKL